MSSPSPCLHLSHLTKSARHIPGAGDCAAAAGCEMHGNQPGPSPQATTLSALIGCTSFMSAKGASLCLRHIIGLVRQAMSTCSAFSE